MNVLEYVAIFISIVALFISWNMWRLRKKDYIVNKQPHLYIIKIYNDLKISKLIRVPIANNNDLPYNPTNVYWTGSVPAEVEYGFAEHIESVNKEEKARIKVVYVQLNFREIEFQDEGRLVVEYRDFTNKLSKVKTPKVIINNLDIENKRQLVGTYLIK